ncbi:sugar ABC transporter substrate-binding protein [Alkalihalobacillus pseudalcaliphilus]|uniref:sugar ABC transporter substrate-binding protein n=1 Tax=Alkalihalobacillus pseudalcaliphilus TaxID=79884 RepID=UPI00064DE1A7|nr:extracellular solute-binding protein [Alkalihalobacillus pseudalcaliphilus]KMK74673.1 cyclodextrin-binding protein [Alkalihalobacillus pseudalcaliphilus]
MEKSIKWLSFASSAILAFTLVACGPQESSNDGTEGSNSDSSRELLIWEDQDKAEGIAAAVSEFEELHDVTITVVEKTYAQQIEDLRLDGPAGTGPDVFTMPADQIGTAVTEGLLKDLDVAEDLQAQYTDAAMLSQIVDGKVYGLPKAVETTLLYYNKDLINEEELPQTLDEWYEYSKEVTGDGNFGFLALFDQIYYAQSVLGGHGAYVFGQDENGNYDASDIGLATDEAFEGAKQIQRFYEEGLFPSGIIGEQGISVLDSLFSEGKAAAVISGPWNLEPFSRAGIDYGVKKLPELNDGENMSAFMGVKSYNVSSYSKNTELAEELVKFLANEENSRTRYEETLEVPAVQSLASDPVVTESEAAKAVAEQSQFSELTPNIPEMNEVWEPIDAALQTIATGRASPEDALTQAVETIQRQIEANHSR